MKQIKNLKRGEIIYLIETLKQIKENKKLSKKRYSITLNRLEFNHIIKKLECAI